MCMKKSLFFLPVLFFILFIFLTLFFLSPLQRLSSSIATRISSHFACDASHDAVLDLALKAKDAELLKKENAELRTELQFIERTASPHIFANVIARSSLSPSLFVIDRGLNDGLVEGSAVVVEEGLIIGTLFSVQQTTATVRTLTHPEAVTAVSLLHESQTIGIVEGFEGQLMRVRFIPQDVTIEPNDLLVTSGLDPLIPPGLLVGMVNTVRMDETTPFQEAIIEPLRETRLYTHVMVLLPQSIL